MKLNAKPKILPGTATSMMKARNRNRPPPEPEPVASQSLGRDYAAPYIRKEEEAFKKASRILCDDVSDIASHGALSEVDSMTQGTMATTIEESNIYEKYDFDQRSVKSQNLVVHSKKDEILEAIAVNRVVIIKGATGCGKTTQVPQFILDSAREKNLHCKIVVTQPRRIAATSIAARVCQERRWRVGDLVGYQIGLDRKAGDDTRILYVTTGVLLYKLIESKDLKEFTHFIIDEIHERNQDMDFLLIVVRNFLNTKSKDARLIIMSATMDSSKFYDYLVTYYNEMPFPPHVVDIVEPSRFEILEFFLDDLIRGSSRIIEAATLVPFTPNSPNIDPNAYRTAAHIILGLDRVDSISEQTKGHEGKPAVLVFLPGIHEIETMEKTLKEMARAVNKGWLLSSFEIKPWHSSITTQEQQDILLPSKPGTRKIILSTNIAESSVTVADIKYVIDFCLTKSLVSDTESGCTHLELMWASRNSLIQRAGRVGRVSDGRVYRLITRDFYENLDQESVPEILRCPLETLVLKAKLLEMGSPKKVLALALDQPDLSNINQAVATLKEIGALLLHMPNGRYDESDGDITFMGKVIARLPLDVRLAKLIFLGNVLGVVEECIVMACAMAAKSIFSTPYGKHLDSYDMKLNWAQSSCSDCIAFLNAYKTWRQLSAEGFDSKQTSRKLTSKGPKESTLLTAFTRDNFLQQKMLEEVSELEDDIKRRLSHLNLYKLDRFRYRYREQPAKMSQGNDTDEKLRPFFLKLAIAGAFYPNYFMSDKRMDENEAIKIVGGHDPFTSVYLQGLPSNQPTGIYKKTIKEQFHSIADRLDVNVDHSSKAYVTFRRPITEEAKYAIPGKIDMAVYRAIKMRQADVKFTIPRLKLEEANNIRDQYVKRNSHREVDENTQDELQRKLNVLVWPWKKVKRNDMLQGAHDYLEVQICYVVSPHRFWVQSSLSNIENLIKNTLRALNGVDVLTRLPADANLAIGSVYAALNQDRGSDIYYRCRIVSKKLKKNKTPEEYTYTIHFMDYGKTITDTSADNIMDVAPEVREEFFIDDLPDLAVECSLAKLQPIGARLIDNSSQFSWPKKATDTLKARCYRPAFAKIYSVVNDILKVKLIFTDQKYFEYDVKRTVNFEFIAKGYAEKVDEDCLSLLYREDLKQYKKLREAGEVSVKFGWEQARDAEHADINPSEDSCSKESEVEKLSFDDIDLTVPGTSGSRTDVFLKGPFNPLEMNITCLTLANACKKVRIEKDSVNSVLLDTAPSDPKNRMVVSAFVGTNQAKDVLNLRHTTIMQNVPALPMLCCLVFSPMVELRCDKTRTHYCGAVCGLGYDRETKNSYFPSNDVEIVFDHKIDENVLILINKIRFRLSTAFDPAKMGKNAYDHLEETRDRLKEYLRELFGQTTYELKPTQHTGKMYHWGLYDVNQLLNPNLEENENQKPHPADTDASQIVFRLIWAVKRTGDEKKLEEAIINNLIALKKFSDSLFPQSYIECVLCGTIVKEPNVAKLHLKLRNHRCRAKGFQKRVDDYFEQMKETSAKKSS